MLGLINQNDSKDREKTPYLTLCFEPSVKIFELQIAWLKLMLCWTFHKVCEVKW